MNVIRAAFPPFTMPTTDELAKQARQAEDHKRKTEEHKRKSQQLMAQEKALLHQQIASIDDQMTKFRAQRAEAERNLAKIG